VKQNMKEEKKENHTKFTNTPLSVREIMIEIEKEFGPDMPVLKIINQAVENNIAREKVEEVIEVMKRDGILFSPLEGVLKFVR